MAVFVKTVSAAAAIVAGLGGAACAQTAKDLVGSWSLVSVSVDQGDSHLDVFGPHPKGLLMLGADGRFAVLEMRDDLRPFAGKTRGGGTPEENKAVVAGSIGYYGRYTVDEAARAITYHIEVSTFPNWSGTEQVRPFTLAGDELTYVSPGSLGLGPAKIVWKRAQ